MVAGIEVLMFRPDDEVKKLARLAHELGLDPLFTEEAPEIVLERLAAAGEAGERWLSAFRAAQDPWFLLSTGDGFYHHHKSWKQDLSIPFSALRRYLGMLARGESIERPIERLKAERERLIASYRALLPGEEERAAFDQMLGLCHLVFPFVEDHKFYCEHWYTTLFYEKIRAFGALLAKFGVIPAADDIFMLHYLEAQSALMDLSLAWAAGSPPRGRTHWPPIIARRRRILEALKAWDPPAALGPLPEEIGDPALLMLWGITSENLERWSAQLPEGETGREIRGFAAAPGVVEGPARVVRDVAEIHTVGEGEILVCPVTNPSWGAVFGKIRAAVSDIGGTMSHAAIVAREYGMPAVVGTGVATRRIRTGQRIRVDGDRGIVTLLD